MTTAVANTVEDEEVLEEKRSYLHSLVKTFYDFQDTRISFDNRFRQLLEDKDEEEEPDDFIVRLAQDARSFEDKIEKEISDAIQGIPLFERYLSKVKGIGDIMGANIIARLATKREYKQSKKKRDKPHHYATVVDEDEDWWYVEAPSVMEVANTVSSLWKYSGYAPDQSREKGKQANWNPDVKKMIHKCSTSFIRANGRYAEIYRSEKENYHADPRHDDKSDGHIDNMARRKIKKLFLQHLWVTFREFRGLEKTQPYVQAHENHADIIPPFTEDNGLTEHPEWMAWFSSS